MTPPATSSNASPYTQASFHLSSHCTRWLFPNLPLLSQTKYQELQQNTSPESLPQQPQSPADFLHLFAKYNFSHKLTEESFLNWFQEQVIIQDTIQKMLQLMNAFDKEAQKMPHQRQFFTQRVKATAIMYFRRFFHQKSVMEYNVTHLLVACMFLASKAEEVHLDVTHFENRLEQLTGKNVLDRSVILPAELVLLDALDFDLQILHPYRSLVALIHTVYQSSLQPEVLNTLINRSNALLDDILYRSNVALVFSPGVIALGILYAALDDLQANGDSNFNETHIASLDAYIEQHFKQQPSSDRILKQIQEARLCARDLPTPDRKEVKKIAKKMKPILKLVEAYHAKQQEDIKDQLKEEAKRKEKKREEALREDEEKIDQFLTGGGSEEKRSGGLFG